MLQTLSWTFGFLYALALTAYLLIRAAGIDDGTWISLAHTFAPYYFVPLPFFLFIALLSGARTVTLWLLGLAVVGLAWFAPLFAVQAASEVTPDVTVITYNMKRETLDLAAWLRDTDADLVFLQEIPFYKDYLETLSAELDDLYLTALRNRPPGGNAILSKYPLSDAPTVVSWDGTPPLQAEADIAGQTIALYNVHLKNPLNSAAQFSILNERVRQQLRQRAAQPSN